MDSWPVVNLPSNVTLSGKLSIVDSVSGEAFSPILDNQLKMYVCGITPYDSAHLGHIFTYLVFDVLNRTARALGANVQYVQNVTDIDDPLFERARQIGRNWEEIVNSQLDKYKEGMSLLRILPPTYFVSVTEEINSIIEASEDLSEKSYKIGTNTYLEADVNALQDFTSMSLTDLFTLSAQRGGDPEIVGKRHPLDPKLWVTSQSDEPKWPSIYGDGRPGWHIECIAIANKYLPGVLDVQGGGADLRFPHHAFCNQISSSLFDRKLARGFMHVGLVSYQGEKMSKSLGNLVFLDDLLNQGYSTSEIRLALLQQDWRESWEFDFSIVDRARDILSTWRSRFKEGIFPTGEEIKVIIESGLMDNFDIVKTLEDIDEAINDSKNPYDNDLAFKYIEYIFGIDVKSSQKTSLA